MRIASFSVGMNAYRESSQVLARRESLDLRTGKRTGESRRPTEPQTGMDRVSLTSDAASVRDTAKAGRPVDIRLSPKDRLTADTVRRMVKAVTGHDVVIRSPEELYRKLEGTRKLSMEIGYRPPEASRITQQAPARFSKSIT